ncbi:MAG: hypothetical protein ACI9MR_003271 [Myxococcota bacterium]
MHRFLGLLLLLVVALAPSEGHAKDLAGRLGIGIEQGLSGVSGLAIRYFPSEAIAVSATAGLDLTFDSTEGTDDLAVGWQGSMGVAFHVARSLHAHLGLAPRLTLARNPGRSVQVNIELPLFLEFFLSDHFSVGAATGILINIVPDDGPSLSSPGTGGTQTNGAVGIGFGAGSVTSTLAVLYYF